MSELKKISLFPIFSKKLVLVIFAAMFTSTCRKSTQNEFNTQIFSLGMLIETIKVDLPNLSVDINPLEFILVKPGMFNMQSPTNELGRTENDWSVHHNPETAIKGCIPKNIWFFGISNSNGFPFLYTRSK